MNKYVIYGAGDYGERIIEYVGEKNIAFYIDQDTRKQRTGFNRFRVFSVEDAVCRLNEMPIIIALSNEKIESVKKTIEKYGVNNVYTFREIQMEKTRERLLKRKNNIEVYERAIGWINENTIEGEGIVNNNVLRKSYPEVTGYFIPTLIRWGHRELAVSYARWLCSIQDESGAWFDTDKKAPYIFDSAQILKGLVAVQKIYPDKVQIKKCILKGADWILGNMSTEGRLIAPDEKIWGDKSTMSELIHLYCLSPLIEISRIYNIDDYEKKAKFILQYYINNCKTEILNFNLLSHFYAYVIEGLVDLEEYELASEAMEKISKKQSEEGAVPGYNNVSWVCTTGLFQLAIIWFKLGDKNRGEKAFNYACGLQNSSGGWYGSCRVDDSEGEENTYFPNVEISWAVKYFLDALYYRNILQFEMQAHTFGDTISICDGRYLAIEEVLTNKEQMEVLDVGCGKGRYLRNLKKKMPRHRYHAVDLSTKVMSYFEDLDIECKQGSLTNIPYEDESFDVVYTCETLEHAVDISSAVCELVRVTKKGGKVLIVDKNIEKLGYFEIEEWEQWFNKEDLKEIMERCSLKVEIISNLSFDGNSEKDLFVCWKGSKL